ncbi:cell division protein ZipA [Vibrio sp. Of7-15]|uniref:cell division protein ZipA n=1 Tax=Vibrio sp. Of7-15 TaxID=2724879 RepID=UPI001EF2FA2D|nr:cell division protein ZipA [Vibrio sp. Of7-15]MCG7498460.1 cell division protein ZipA [Vibrio sp. Of7-15]
MQELRLVLIIVGALAIGALLFHGLWTSRKEKSTKFGDKPLSKLDDELDEESDQNSRSAGRAFSQVGSESTPEPSKTRKEPEFGFENNIQGDPLLDSGAKLDNVNSAAEPVTQPAMSTMTAEVDIPHDSEQQAVSFTAEAAPVVDEVAITEPEPVKEDVIVLHVHITGEERFKGPRLFNSLEQNGLLFGEMAIYHRHADLAGTGKVLFSVANMVAPGNFRLDNPDEFETPGIAFFMTLPCYGEADHNFKLMLKTAQQIADDLGGHVLDEHRNLMTPNKLDEYRERVRQFVSEG